MFTHLESKNYSYYAVILQFFIALTPRLWLMLWVARDFYPKEPWEDFALIGKNGEALDNKWTRRFIATQRCVSNSFDELPLFAAAVVAANLAALPVHEINLFAALYVIIRLVYAVVYIFVETTLPLRTLVWMGASSILGYMFYRAGIEQGVSNPACNPCCTNSTSHSHVPYNLFRQDDRAFWVVKQFTVDA
ncbi:hypothetical protein BJ170DRAFT_594861 [Xylariales sp. AK1849]|nr:hypothetical protein BJ170DRAFT_594861 [Xylariales sp. AK1849]